MSGVPKNGKPQLQPLPPQHMEPQLTDFTAETALVPTDQGPRVRLRLFTVIGPVVLFMPPDGARALANALQASAGGIVIADSTQVPQS